MDILRKDLKHLVRANSEKEAEQYLADGWVILKICCPNELENNKDIVYVLGKP
jgi:hypothetical protein